MIIAHGLYGSSDNWVSIARLLSPYFEVTLIDQRNHGNSPYSNEHNYRLMKDDLLEFMDDHQIKKAILIGHSMGGKTVMHFAKDYPGRVSSLIVADIWPFGYPADSANATEHLFLINSLLSLDLKSLRSREEASRKLGMMIRDDRIRGFLLKNLYRRNDGQFSWKINLEVLRDSIPELISGFDEKETGPENQITGFPVLFLRGAKSSYIPLSSINSIKKIFPNSEIATIPGAGHWLHAEQPELFVKNILYFLKIPDQK